MSYVLGTHPPIEEAIISSITLNQGMKETALVADLEVLSYFVELDLRFSLLLEVVDALIREEKILCIEYVLPNLPDRVKTFLFPPGTKLGIPPGSTVYLEEKI